MWRFASNAFWILFLLAFAATAKAGTINLDKFDQTRALGQYFQYLEDSSGILTLKNILAGDHNLEWQQFDGDVANFGFTSHVFWFRTTVDSGSHQGEPYILDVAYAALRKVDTYQIGDNNAVAQSSIGEKPFSDRPIKERGFVFPLTFKAKRSQLLIRVDAPYQAVQVPIFIKESRHFYESRHNLDKLEGIFVGILAAMIFYNLFLYFSLKKSDYLNYVGFIFFNCVLQASLSGIGFEHIWPNFPAWQDIAASVTVPALIIAAVQFIIGFLEINKNGDQKAMLRILQSFKVMGVIGVVEPFIYPHPMVTLCSVAAAVLTCSTVQYMSLSIWLKGYGPAKYFTIAWTAFLIGSVVRAMNKFGILPFNDFTESIQQIGAVIECIVMSFSLGEKINYELSMDQQRISSLNDSLTKYVGKVEMLVEEQTRQIASIMSHIEQGIFTLGMDLTIEKYYSKNLESILEQTDLARKNVFDVFLNASDLSKDDLALIESTLGSSIGEADFIFATNSHHLPSVVHIRNKTIEMNWQSIVDASGNTEKVLVTSRDVTELRALEELSNQHRLEMTRVAELLAIVPTECEAFFDDCLASLREIEVQMEASSINVDKIVKAIFIQLHTMKGTARRMRLKSLVNAIHEAETHCSIHLNSDKGWDSKLFQESYHEVEATLRDYMKLCREKLGRTQTNSLDNRMLEEGSRLFESLPDVLRQEFFEFGQKLRSMRFTSLTDIIGSLRQQASVLAEQLGKPVPRIQAHGPHHEFRKETGQLIAHALMHLLSNSLDHGVETAAEREAAGKPRQPLISISLSSGEHGLRISYRDDGQGLILGRIRDIGVSKSLIAPQEQRPHILANLIFETGFSSSTKLTDVSGRGIGMEAARSLLAKVSANLELVLLESVESLDRPVPIEFRISFVEERFQVAA